MVRLNEDPRGTAYTVTVDAADRMSTGISAADRAHTLNVLADPSSTPSSVIRPGHVVPLRAVDGGVRVRAGHTEAAVDLLRLAGLTPVAAIAEINEPDGTMTRLPGLLAARRGRVRAGHDGRRDHRAPRREPRTLHARRDQRPAAAPAHPLRGREDRCPRPTAPSPCAPTATSSTGADHVAIISGRPGSTALSCASTRSV